ncbi:Uncharacterized protein PECH_000009 [Penicillium ucsense]|uniref:Plus3 domain-containing protein n=1 Tax=Penicillium ucsense TaxID=2839758 RepID=A0A8J8W268_9EURO|nr:Uncharacterized protein PECM_007765 [Penicillium ucsense]KAF7739497.1 Uncharacterized protein PECH_000009 [Penicillium ucsense]
MADDLDAELLALAGDSEEEQTPPPQDNFSQHSPSSSNNFSHHEHSPDILSPKGHFQSTRHGKNHHTDEEDGEISEAESQTSLRSASMLESDSEDDELTDNEDKPIFPYEKLYYSAVEKQEIAAMPEIKREELLTERAQQVDRHNQDLALRRLLASRGREESRAAAKRKAGTAGLDEAQRKSSRQKTTLGGRKVGETSGAMEAYKRQREQKGKRVEARRRDTAQSRRRSSQGSRRGSGSSQRSAGADSDLVLDNRRSPSPPKEDPPATLREINRARVGRSNFAQVCFTPGFEELIPGCYTRLSIGPDPQTGENVYRMCLIKSITTGKPYAIEGMNGRNFVTDQYAKLSHGNAVREWPFILCSNSPFTEAEFNRYQKTLEVEKAGTMPTQSQVAAKVADINRLINYQFTPAELTVKLRRSGVLTRDENIIRRAELERRIKAAEDDENDELVEKLQKELEEVKGPKLAFGTSLTPQRPKNELPSDIERVAQINRRNRKLNYENGRRAELQERAAARKNAAAVARGEAAPDPFMRVRTVAKTFHDMSGQDKGASVSEDATAAAAAASPEKPKEEAKPSILAKVLAKRPKGGFRIRHAPHPIEILRAYCEEWADEMSFLNDLDP